MGEECSMHVRTAIMYGILVGNLVGRHQLCGLGVEGKIILKMDLCQIVFEDVYWLEFFLDAVQWRPLILAVLSFWILSSEC
jgi:hypothetical protein